MLYTHPTPTHTPSLTDLLSPLIRNKLTVSQRSYKLWAGELNNYHIVTNYIELIAFLTNRVGTCMYSEGVSLNT